MNRRCGLLVLVLLAVLPVLAAGQDRPSRDDYRPSRGDRPRPRPDRPTATTIPAAVAPFQSLSVVLGRPTDHSITASVLSADHREGYIEFGPASGKYTGRTEVVQLPAGVPVEVPLEKLDRDRPYFYRLQHRKAGSGADVPLTAEAEHSFHTQRASGGTFTFDIQGDSHPERPHENDLSLYAQTLAAAAGDRPDFYVCMGDDFSVDALRTANAETVTGRYGLQRPFLSLVAHSAPLFLVNGNHEQAALCNFDGTPNNVAVWAQNARNLYFPQPAPDGFYTGNQKKVEHIGFLRNYFAWTWGAALFVVIDPYWHSGTPVDNAYGGGEKARDLWAVTLGDDQYQWLKKTLESSRSSYRFVFAHHVHGTTRGGIEQAPFYEWGGKDRSGIGQFGEKRPGWAMPIHQLMARNGVTIFFQGHDHVFAHQQLDGVTYQTVPEPADPSYGFAQWASEYRSGDILPNSGRLRVTVAPDKVRVEYVRSYLSKDATAERHDGQAAFAYQIASRDMTATTQPEPAAGK